MTPGRSVRLTTLPRPAADERTGESGTTLIIALVFVIVIGLLTVSLLGLAQAGARGTRAYKVERTNRYGVENALNAGIIYIAQNPDVGVSGGTASCFIQVGIEGDVRVVVGNSYYTVECAATSPSTGGASSDSGKVVDGVQNPRDVTIKIGCGHDAANPVRVGFTSCGTGTSTVVATARVRFDRDTSPTIDPTKSAIIPKVLSWELRG